MQRITVIGNIGSDSKIMDSNNQKVINFSVGSTERFKNKEGVQTEKTTWYDCAMWKRSDQSVEIAKYLIKGAHVLIEGKPSADTYTDKNTGEIRINFRINVEKVVLL